MQQSIGINPALRDFDQLPDSAMVRLPTVAALFGCSKATIWRMCRAKKLSTYKLSERCTTFSVKELRQALALKVEA